jgi:hypothetical protein
MGWSALNGKGPSTASDARMHLFGTSVAGDGFKVGMNPGTFLSNAQGAIDALERIKSGAAPINAASNNAIMAISKGAVPPVLPGPNTDATPSASSTVITPNGGTAKTQLGVAPQPSAATPIIATQAAYDRLPAGATYFGADGKTAYRKGQ